MAQVSHDELLANPLTYRPASAKDDDPASYYGVMRSYDFVVKADEENDTLALQETLRSLRLRVAVILFLCNIKPIARAVHRVTVRVPQRWRCS